MSLTPPISATPPNTPLPSSTDGNEDDVKETVVSNATVDNIMELIKAMNGGEPFDENMARMLAAETLKCDVETKTSGPLEGRATEGGFKIGEMESNSEEQFMKRINSEPLRGSTDDHQCTCDHDHE